MLHTCSKVYSEEVDAVARLGLALHQRPDGHLVFALPCPRHKDDKCTVYDDRPKACRIYRCKLLKRYLQGKIDFEASLSVVQRAKELIAVVRQRIRIGQEPSRFWDQLSSFFSKQPPLAQAEVAGDPFLMDLAELSALCRGNFENHGELHKVMIR